MKYEDYKKIFDTLPAQFIRDYIKGHENYPVPDLPQQGEGKGMEDVRRAHDHGYAFGWQFSENDEHNAEMSWQKFINQSPSNPPEVKDQPKPDKTAEIDLDAILDSLNFSKTQSYRRDQTKKAMSEAIRQSQSTSSLRDALEHLVEIIENDDLMFPDFPPLLKAKALLTANNTQDKKEE